MSSSKAKKERRLKRHLRNVEKDREHKKNAWEEGKIIYENHNGGYFSNEYSIQLIDRLCSKIINLLNISNSQEDFIIEYRKYKKKIIDAILKYSPEIEKTKNYEFLKLSLETYWDNQTNLFNTLKNDRKQ